MPVLQYHEWFTNKKEFEIIKKYQMTNDRSILTDALRDLKKPSPVMRKSIAVIFEGNELIPHFKSVPRRKNEFSRNLKIAFKVHSYFEETDHLKGKRDGAIEKVANEKFDGKILSGDTIKNIYSPFATVLKRLDVNNPESFSELFDMITASVKGFDEACLYKLKPFLSGESFEVGVTKTEPPD